MTTEKQTAEIKAKEKRKPKVTKYFIVTNYIGDINLLKQC